MRKRVEWTCVQTYVPPALHARLVALRQKTGLPIDYWTRRAIELSIQQLERTDAGVRAATGAGAGVGAR